MWLKWFPWKYIIRKTAQRHGFLDPMTIWSYVQNFSQPSEVAGPIELIRDSAAFHARGLINSRAIPQNPDWIWPYWIHRQFNPNDESFIPRAFSLTYINLTERNWTAVGLPDCGYLPIIDAAGLVTPHWDGWSLDFWLVDKQGHVKSAARSDGRTLQRYSYGRNLAVVTKTHFGRDSLRMAVELEYVDETPTCRIRARSQSDSNGWLAISLRPYNPEGISFLHTIELNDNRDMWTVNERDRVIFDQTIDQDFIQNYSGGDVSNYLAEPNQNKRISCDVGMATAAALFTINHRRDVSLRIPLNTRKLHPPQKNKISVPIADSHSAWTDTLEGYCKIKIPDKEKEQLYELALRSVVLHTVGQDIYPGPFTYKRFWFRDASFILNALLCANLPGIAKPVLDSYPRRQTLSGYFQSQQGEWDSNGQAIWILSRYWKMAQVPIQSDWLKAIEKAADWICHKCTDPTADTVHAGLLPAGFSAEHFGPNDYYYWDDFWAVSGLELASEIFTFSGHGDQADKYIQKANELRSSIERSLEKVTDRLNTPAIPVSPHRRMDSGAVGSIVCGYPLQLFDPKDKRLTATVNYLMKRCRYKKGFFLDISHSGINPYLTLHIAQVLLRAGDTRHVELADALCRLASPTGQWPEAVHPRTEGGCMGDGQHIWAAAEWVNYLRNCLVLEEENKKQLILGAGIEPQWLKQPSTITIGPTLTLWGLVSVKFECRPEGIHVHYTGQWHNEPPKVWVKIPGYPQTAIPETETGVIIKKN